MPSAVAVPARGAAHAAPKAVAFGDDAVERAWMAEQLSYTPILAINGDGSYGVERVRTDFYLANDEWRASHFLELDQFAAEKDKAAFKRKGRKKGPGGDEAAFRDYVMRFRFDNRSLNMEAKFVFHQMIFAQAWSLNTACFQENQAMKKLAAYVNGRRPDISPISQFDDALQADYIAWLEEEGYRAWQTNTLRNRKRRAHTPAAKVVKIVAGHYERLLADFRAERWPDRLWEGDRWKASHFKAFGIDAVKAAGTQTIDFGAIESGFRRSMAKSYLRQRVTSHAIAWSTAAHKCAAFALLSNFVSRAHPEWGGLEGLSRADIVLFAEELARHAVNRERAGLSRWNDETYPAKTLTTVRAVIRDMQMLDVPGAPRENAYKLIRTEDTSYGSRSLLEREVRYVPDKVIDQLFANFDKLGETWRPIVLTLFYTGLRISDVLEMKAGCLVTVNGQPMLEVDVRKTRVEGHRLPVPGDYADIMRAHIARVESASNDFNNPERYIFAHLTGPRRGCPPAHSSVYQALNEFAIECGILGEDGEVYRFRNHAFRHTYAVRLLNNGAGLMTVQELLAHRSPEMTLVYAKLLDDTKFREFARAVEGGAFTFSDGAGAEIVYHGDVPEEILRSAWANQKLNAVDTPYGTCLQRKGGRCRFALQPPCLTCDDGAPCKDLCVGAADGDTEKYEILIDSARRMADSARRHGRADMADENEAVLRVLLDVKAVLDGGGVIYGRPERLGL